MANYISYGGIVLYLNKTDTIDLTSIREGLDYVYTEVRIKVRTVLNPYATSYQNLADPGQTPVPSYLLGQSPTDTLNAIRNTLSQPRQQLIFNNYDYFIVSPVDGSQCDITGGPFPENVVVEAIQGETTFLVTFDVRTTINECLLDNPILSNRWSSSWDTDSQMRNTIHYNGKAVLALNALLDNGFNPGQFVTSLLPYVQPYYYRDRINIHYDENQHVITYQCSDIERRYYALGDLSSPGSPASQYFVTSFTCNLTCQTINMSSASGDVNNVSQVAPGISLVTMDGEVKGSEKATTGGLIQFAFLLINEKLITVLGLNYQGLSNVKITRSIDSPDINFSITVQANIANVINGQVQGPPPPPPVVFTGSLAQNLLFRDPVVQFLDGYQTNPQLTWGGYFQFQDQTITPIFQDILGACSVPCNSLAVPFSSYTDVCSGPAINGLSYLTTKPTTPTYQPPSSPTYNTYYSGISGIYNYEVKKTTYTEYNTHVLPTTSPPPSNGNYGQQTVPTWSTVPYESRSPSEVVSLAAPISYVDIDWVATSATNPPPIPSPCFNDSNLTLVGSHITPFPVFVDQSGSNQLFRIEGKYKYVNTTFVQPGDQLGGVVVPYLSLTYDDVNIPTALFQNGIIDQSGSITTPGGSQTIVN